MHIANLTYYDPRAKLATGLILIISVLFFNVSRPQTLAFILFLLVLVWILGRNYQARVFRDMLRFYPMLFLITVHLIFHEQGQNGILFEYGFVRIYSEGLKHFLILNLKSLFIVNVSFLLVHSITHEQLVSVLKNWHLADWIIAILTYLNRLLHLFAIETNNLKMSLQSRNLHIKSIRALRLMIKIVPVYLSRVYERSERTFQAMLSRGFNGTLPITYQLRWKVADSFFLASGLTLLLGYWLCQII